MNMTGSLQALELRRTLERLWVDAATQLPATEAGAMSSAELALYAPAGPLRLAVDRNGSRHLLLPLSDDDPNFDGWRSAGVNLTMNLRIVEGEAVRFLDLECRRDDLTGVFTGLVAHVCSMVAREQKISAAELAAMLESWRELLGGDRQTWTVSKLGGLYGELLVLESLLAQDPTATAWWTGPTGAPQDFRKGAQAIEVKSTTSTVGRMVRIHGVDQLETPEKGDLTLIWRRFAVVSRGEGDNIPSVVERCLAQAASSGLLTRLDRLGLPSLSSADVCSVGFKLIEERSYHVDATFPRVVPDSFRGGAVPPGVLNIDYVVDLDSVPSHDGEVEDFLRSFLKAA
jgi:hypothetical protein